MQVTSLNPEDPSPFRIGRIDKGQHTTTLETGGTLAPVAGHEAPHSAFLLVRKPTGHLFLRRFTGTLLVCCCAHTVTGAVITWTGRFRSPADMVEFVHHSLLVTTAGGTAAAQDLSFGTSVAGGTRGRGQPNCGLGAPCASQEAEQDGPRWGRGGCRVKALHPPLCTNPLPPADDPVWARLAE
jgi:hypothetical protein